MPEGDEVSSIGYIEFDNEYSYTIRGLNDRYQAKKYLVLPIGTPVTFVPVHNTQEDIKRPKATKVEPIFGPQNKTHPLRVVVEDPGKGGKGKGLINWSPTLHH